MNREAWAKTIEVYNEAARRGLSLSPGVYYDLMRTAVLMANAGQTDALGFAEHCMQEMSALGERSSVLKPESESLMLLNNLAGL